MALAARRNEQVILRTPIFQSAGSTGQCNTACSLSAGISNPKVLRGR
jgi:hypothetical protein